MRSEEWRTSDAKRSSLRREYSSSVSSALSSASETWVASARRPPRSSVPGLLGDGDEQQAAHLLARGEREDEHARRGARQADVRAQRGEQRAAAVVSGSPAACEERLARSRRRARGPGGRRRPGRGRPRSRTIAVLDERDRARRAGAQLGGRLERARRRAPRARSRRRTRSRRRSARAGGRTELLLLAHEPGHAGHDEDEEDDGGEDDDDEVDVAAADLGGDLDDRRDERRERQQREADRREARGVVVRRGLARARASTGAGRRRPTGGRS